MSGQTNRRIIIIGAGGHGRVVLDILLQQRRNHVVGFLDSNPAIRGRRIDGIPVYGALDDLPRFAAELECDGVIVAIGDNGVRRGFARTIMQSGIELVNAIHPSANLASNVTVGKNVVIAAGVVVCANCQIGDSTILNTGCIVDHQTMVGEGCHVCPGVRIAGRVRVEPGAFLGIGATVVPNVSIGCEAIVGAGAVVLEDVPALATVVGVPARTVQLASASEDEVAMLGHIPTPVAAH
ncbi:MAG: acetyltransferase [Phycisphaerae bacterium]